MTTVFDLKSYDDIEEWYGEGREISDGGSAWVLEDPNDPTMCARFTRCDLAHESFVQYVLDGCFDGNPHAPVLYAYEQCGHGDGYVVIMETLSHLPYEHVLRGLGCDYWSDGWLELFGSGDLDEARRNIIDGYPDTIGHECLTDEFLLLQQELHYIGHDHGFNVDMHDMNIMERADGTAVITDPWC